MNPSSTLELRTGNRMPVIGLGTWQMSDPAHIVRYALNIGYRMIDTSRDYGTQVGVGKGLRKSGLPRDKVYIVTKVEENEDTFEAARRNVEEMGLEYADLILIHRPPSYSADEDLWQGLIKAKEQGLTRDIGVSNYSVGEIDRLIRSSGVVPAVNQIEWTPFGHDQRMLDYCLDKDIVIQAYSPLTREKKVHDKRLCQLAEHYDKSPEQILLRWSIQLGTVPLPKSDNLAHLRENLDVFDFQISEDDMAILNGVNARFSSLSSLQYI